VLARLNYEETVIVLSGLLMAKIMKLTLRRSEQQYSETWILWNYSAFALEPRQATEKLGRFGRSQDYPDGN
jgi:hypothetical protein